MKEQKLRRYIRSLIKEQMSSKRSTKNNLTEEQRVRGAVRREIKRVLADASEKGQLNEAVGGMVDLGAVGGVYGTGSGRVGDSERDNFSYNSQAVLDRVSRELQSSGKKTSLSEQRVTFVNEETQQSVALWVEGGQLVCEIKSDKGTQKTQLSEGKTKSVVQYILSESVLDLNG